MKVNAADIIRSWPEWKRKIRLTKYSPEGRQQMKINRVAALQCLKDRGILDQYLNAYKDNKVLIWSDEWCMYWRPDGCGYTGVVSEAGIYTFQDAVRRSAHCGPEKKIEYCFIDESEELSTDEIDLEGVEVLESRAIEALITLAKEYPQAHYRSSTLQYVEVLKARKIIRDELARRNK